jgi:leucyl-tRNA synthetase
LRGIIIADKTTSKDNLLKTLANYPKINEYLVNKKIVKIIFVSKKIANIIVK